MSHRLINNGVRSGLRANVKGKYSDKSVPVIRPDDVRTSAAIESCAQWRSVFLDIERKPK